MVTVTLPHGFAVDGRWHREATLRPVGEALLWSGAGALNAREVTRLLAACLVRLGPHEAVTEQQVAGLTVGDREALLLHLRRITFGEQLDAVLTCAACGARMDLTLKVPDLLLPPYEEAEPWHEVSVDDLKSELRPPTGADQAAVAAVADFDVEGAAEALLLRCLRERPSVPLTPAAREALSAKLAELDPQAEVLLSFICPECGAPGEAALDTAAYLGRELASRQQALLLEVHYLALHYHWSEAEILAVDPARRRQYLKLLGLIDRPEEGLL